MCWPANGVSAPIDAVLWGTHSGSSAPTGVPGRLRPSSSPRHRMWATLESSTPDRADTLAWTGALTCHVAVTKRAVDGKWGTRCV
jgi:hypothetical protein